MYNNPYMTQYRPMEQQPNYMQQPQQPIQQPNYMQYSTQLPQKIGLVGKMVESIEMAKNSEIEMSGNTVYMPLLDKSAIVTKRLTNDGTSEVIVYKPVKESEKEETKNIQYVTLDAFNNFVDELDLSDLIDIKNDISDIKKQLKEFSTKSKTTKGV